MSDKKKEENVSKDKQEIQRDNMKNSDSESQDKFANEELDKQTLLLWQKVNFIQSENNELIVNN